MISPAGGAPGTARIRGTRQRAQRDSALARLDRDGAESLTTADLLGLVLDPRDRAGRTRATVARILSAFTNSAGEPSLRTLARSAPGEMKRRAGVNRFTAARLAAVLEVGRRALEEHFPRRLQLRTADDVYALMRCRLRDLQQEEFHVLVLNARCEAVRRIRLSVGTLTASLIGPREIFREAIRELAAGIVLVHNHPCGNAEPSSWDTEMTGQVVAAAQVLGIAMVDHVIIGDGDCYSFVSLSNKPGRGRGERFGSID